MGSFFPEYRKMKFHPHSMPILRLAYTTLFLIALLAVFFAWSEVGGQSHLDLMPWYLKLILGSGAAFAIVRATSAAVSHDRAWNGQTLRWFGILLILLIGCGLASYYAHLYDEEDDEEEDSVTSSSLVVPMPVSRLPVDMPARHA
jgi:hypothetical protein